MDSLQLVITYVSGNDTLQEKHFFKTPVFNDPVLKVVAKLGNSYIY